MSLVLAGSLIGRIVMGFLADRWARKRVMLLIYLLVALAIPLLFLGHHVEARWAFALLFGIGLGGDYMIIPLMAADLFGVKALGRLMGIVLTADSVAESTAPMLVAGIRDHTGSYPGGFRCWSVWPRSARSPSRSCHRRERSRTQGHWSTRTQISHGWARTSTDSFWSIRGQSCSKAELQFGHRSRSKLAVGPNFSSAIVRPDCSRGRLKSGPTADP